MLMFGMLISAKIIAETARHIHSEIGFVTAQANIMIKGKNKKRNAIDP